MADVIQELQERFAPPNTQLSPEIQTELQSTLNIYSISPEELQWKWDAYCMKMGAEDTKLDLKTVRDFKKDLQEILERESRSKMTHAKIARVAATPKAGLALGGAGDVFGMLDGLVPNTPRAGAPSTTKRKSNFETPSAKSAKNNTASSPADSKTPASGFVGRANAGEIQESLNSKFPIPEPPIQPFAEPRIKLKANNEMSKFAYKTMAMKLSEASEILDDRIDEFTQTIKEAHNLDGDAFGNPAAQSPSEIVAVGRIASDSSEGKLNLASLVLETSRRMGAGLRVPLKMPDSMNFDFFPGKIVALKGTNASGDFFAVSEILDIPLMSLAASETATLDDINARVAGTTAAQDGEDIDLDAPEPSETPLTILAASGPYTTDDSLDFSALKALLSTAAASRADALVLTGPFLDAEHPLIRTGDFDLPASFPVAPDKATLIDVFRYHISQPLQQLAKEVPSISIVLVPSVRDAIAKHVSWPQDRLPRKELGLPKQASVVTNPITLSMNEIVFGISSLDILEQLRASSLSGGAVRKENILDRAVKAVLGQRSYFPLYPPLDRRALATAPVAGKTNEPATSQLEFSTVGTPLDLSYLKLAEFIHIRPDCVILPSSLPPFARFVEGTLAINPGTLMKRRGPGTFARLTVRPRVVREAERGQVGFVGHELWERVRVDVVRI